MLHNIQVVGITGTDWINRLAKPNPKFPKRVEFANSLVLIPSDLLEIKKH
jgi:hypothetical protein